MSQIYKKGEFVEQKYIENFEELLGGNYKEKGLFYITSVESGNGELLYGIDSMIVREDSTEVLPKIMIKNVVPNKYEKIYKLDNVFSDFDIKLYVFKLPNQRLSLKFFFWGEQFFDFLFDEEDIINIKPFVIKYGDNFKKLLYFIVTYENNNMSLFKWNGVDFSSEKVNLIEVYKNFYHCNELDINSYEPSEFSKVMIFRKKEGDFLKLATIDLIENIINERDYKAFIVEENNDYFVLFDFNNYSIFDSKTNKLLIKGSNILNIGNLSHNKVLGNEDLMAKRVLLYLETQEKKFKLLYMHRDEKEQILIREYPEEYDNLDFIDAIDDNCNPIYIVDGYKGNEVHHIEINVDGTMNIKKNKVNAITLVKRLRDINSSMRKDYNNRLPSSLD